MLRAVIFDYNGTLFDDLEVAFGSVLEIFNTYNISPPTLEQYRQEITAKFMDFYCNHGFPLETTASELNAIRKRYYAENASRAKFRSDAEKVLRELKVRGIKLAIVSAEIESVLMERLDGAKLNYYFGSNIKAGVYGDKRPALLEMAKDLNISVEEAAYVDDTVDGTSAAKSLGMIPIAVGSGYNSPERLLTVTNNIIYELSELPDLTRRIIFNV